MTAVAAPLQMYTTPQCPDCRLAKRFLEARGLPFEEINIDEDPGAAALVMRLNGGKRSVPTVVAQTTVINASRFDPKQFERDLRRAGVL